MQTLSARIWGASLEITDVAFDSIIPEVQSGKADFAAGMTVTEDRQTQVDFSDTYATGVQSVIVTEDSDIASLDDLKGQADRRSAGYHRRPVLHR